MVLILPCLYLAAATETNPTPRHIACHSIPASFAPLVATPLGFKRFPCPNQHRLGDNTNTTANTDKKDLSFCNLRNESGKQRERSVAAAPPTTGRRHSKRLTHRLAWRSERPRRRGAAAQQPGTIRKSVCTCAVP